MNAPWTPLPGSQELAVTCPCDRILYEGTRGPGKTEAQLMFFRRYVGCGWGAYWKGIILDRHYNELDDAIGKSKRLFPLYKDGARFLSSKGDYKWIWPTGEELLFRQITDERDYSKYHGHEYPFIGWNELTLHATPGAYDKMMTLLRSGFRPQDHGNKAPPIRLVVFATTNPSGVGHNWVKKRFIDVAPPGKIVYITIDAFNPQTQKREPCTISQVHIFGSYKENKYLDHKYIATLESQNNPHTRKAWLEGDWNIVAGGALDDLWRESIHVIPRFPIPRQWRVDRSFDWGSSHPFSVGWWAEANGEEVILPDGRKWCPASGSLIRINEWYGTKEIGTNKGLGLSSTDVALGIVQRETEMLDNKWIQKQPSPGPADNQIYAQIDVAVDSIGKSMEREGVYWTESNKGPGSRVNGLELIRGRLLEATRLEGRPGLYFMENCRDAIANLPVLPRDPVKSDDVDTASEDHVYDDVRYRVLAGNDRTATHLDIGW